MHACMYVSVYVYMCVHVMYIAHMRTYKHTYIHLHRLVALVKERTLHKTGFSERLCATGMYVCLYESMYESMCV